MDKDERALALRLGAAIRSRRREAGISQEELAERCRSATNYVSYIERGDRLPSIGHLLRMSRALNVDIGALFAPTPPVSDDVDEAITLLGELTPDVRRHAMIMLKALVGTLRGSRVRRKRPA